VAMLTWFRSVPTRGWGRRYKLVGPGGPVGGGEPENAAYVFVFLGVITVCRLHKLTLSDQAQVTLYLRGSTFSKLFRRSVSTAVSGRIQKTFAHWQMDHQAA
jgi:hypothetical protein